MNEDYELLLFSNDAEVSQILLNIFQELGPFEFLQITEMEE